MAVQVRLKLDLAEQCDRDALRLAVAGQLDASNKVTALAGSIRAGYASPEDARDDRQRQGMKLWEEKYGKLDSHQVETKLATFRAALEHEKQGQRGSRANPPPKPSRRRKK
jgi:hypothetical protein